MRGGDWKAMAELAALQSLAREARREALALSCADVDARAAEETRAADECALLGAALDAVYARPQLCIDSLSLAARRLALGEAALKRACLATQAARRDEDTARASLAEAEFRARFVGEKARSMRHRQTDKDAQAATAETIALGLAQVGRP